MPTRVKRRVDITVHSPFKGQLSRSWLRKVVLHALDRALPGEDCQIGLVIADDETLKRLNREYRGLDEVTDVLSFSTFYQGHWEGEGDPPPQPDDDVPFVLPPHSPKHLGEIIISYPQAVRQAAPGPSGLEKELALLVVHGVLHLLGLDHVEPSDEAHMQEKEREILGYLNLDPIPNPPNPL